MGVSRRSTIGYMSCAECTALRAHCPHDPDNTTNTCWWNEHDKCRGLFSRAPGRTLECACPCHDRVSENEVRAAIESIADSVRTRSASPVTRHHA